MRHKQIHGAQNFPCDQCDGPYKTEHSLREQIIPEKARENSQ